MPTTSTPSTTPMYTECEGLQDGTLLPNPNSCLSFYECINELPYPRFCDDGLWFDMNLLACGPPDSVNCTPTMPSTTGQYSFLSLFYVQEY